MATKSTVFKAIKSTIFKANLQIADIDHGYYADHALTLARHPSETDERMMVRLAALALQAHQLQYLCNGDGVLAFGAGLSDPDEPDVRCRLHRPQARVDRSGPARGQGADQGLQQGRRGGAVLLQPCGRDLVEGHRNQALARWRSCRSGAFPTEASQALAQLAERSMQLQATVQDPQPLHTASPWLVEQMAMHGVSGVLAYQVCHAAHAAAEKACSSAKS
jgi:uncharacterized protein YaeQ